MTGARHKRRPVAHQDAILEAIAAVQRSVQGFSLQPAESPIKLDELRDARGYRRTVATTRDFHLGREPRNKGHRYPPDPPPPEESMAILSACAADEFGRRMFAAVIFLWQGALRAFEALALTEADLEQATGRIHIRHGKGDKQATITMAAWAWQFLEPWRAIRAGLPDPAGPLLCIIDGPTAGRAWSYSSLNRDLKKVALQAGVTRRISPHQFRHAWAADAYRAGVPLRTIQLHLRHENIGITDTYLRGLGVDESRQQVYELAVPTVPATALLALTSLGKERGRA